MDDTNTTGAEREEEHRLVAVRRDKVDELRRSGIEPYPLRWENSHSLAQAKSDFEKCESRGDESIPAVSVAGRVAALRDLGKVTFIDITGNGERLQVQLRADLAPKTLKLLKYLDLGDFIGVKGALFRTRRGEITVGVEELCLLSKALSPPPDKWSGLKDLEVRRRQRYLDMIARKDAITTAKKRADIVANVRDYMTKREFVEVETPILNAVAAGAFASRFKTKHAWTEHDLFLRIATELPLKKLLVGGLERVYEIGKVFRNEHVDKSHSAEFTTLEAYQAFASYEDMMVLVENMFAEAARAVNGTTLLPPLTPDGKAVDVSPPWQRINLLEAIEKRCGIDLSKVRQRSQLVEAVENLKNSNRLEQTGAINVTDDMSWARIVDHLISVVLEPHLHEPCYLIDYPVETTPLAKRTAHNKDIVERAEGFIYGIEIANMFTELNDPDDQKQRMLEMEKLNLAYMRKKAARQTEDDSEEDRLDPDFLRAIQYGMPPAGGVGVGVDRLTMLLVGESNIGDVILFPSLYDVS